MTQVYDTFLAWVYVNMATVFIIIPRDYQPILGIFFPLLREILLKILKFITCKAGGCRIGKMGKFLLNQITGYPLLSLNPYPTGKSQVRGVEVVK